MNIENIRNVEKELKRFNKRLQAAKIRLQKDNDILYITGCKETGALKRASLDLKIELTKNM